VTRTSGSRPNADRNPGVVGENALLEHSSSRRAPTALDERRGTRAPGGPASRVANRAPMREVPGATSCTVTPARSCAEPSSHSSAYSAGQDSSAAVMLVESTGFRLTGARGGRLSSPSPSAGTRGNPCTRQTPVVVGHKRPGTREVDGRVVQYRDARQHPGRGPGVADQASRATPARAADESISAQGLAQPLQQPGPRSARSARRARSQRRRASTRTCHHALRPGAPRAQ